ncbi:MAG: glycosyltransferase [Eubacteriales bacterium]
MKVAIVHDWLTNMGGAERVILALHEIFPDAPVYTMVHNPDRLPPEFAGIDIRTSFIQKLPRAKTKYQTYLPLMPMAAEQFDLSGFDVVISSSHACAKGVITRPETLHICYCYTPMRYAWFLYHEYMRLEQISRIKKYLIPPLMNYLRLWDRLAADRVDDFIAISRGVGHRIRKYYRRESAVIFPPVKTDYYTPADSVDDYFLVVSRLVAYKRVDLAVQAFNELGWPLVVIGDGPEMEKLKRAAKPNVKILGRLSDEETRNYYARCKAFIFPGEEDFGITPVEAQASGRPVVAYGAGGALDTVKQGITGEFFYPQTAPALVETLRSLDLAKFDAGIIRRHAQSFDTEKFKKDFHEYTLKKYNEHCALFR